AGFWRSQALIAEHPPPVDMSERGRSSRSGEGAGGASPEGRRIQDTMEPTLWRGPLLTVAVAANRHGSGFQDLKRPVQQRDDRLRHALQLPRFEQRRRALTERHHYCTI